MKERTVFSVLILLAFSFPAASDVRHITNPSPFSLRWDSPSSTNGGDAGCETGYSTRTASCSENRLLLEQAGKPECRTCACDIELYQYNAENCSGILRGQTCADVTGTYRSGCLTCDAFADYLFTGPASSGLSVKITYSGYAGGSGSICSVNAAFETSGNGNCADYVFKDYVKNSAADPRQGCANGEATLTDDYYCTFDKPGYPSGSVGDSRLCGANFQLPLTMLETFSTAP